MVLAILPTSFRCRAALLGHLVDKIQSSGNPDVVIEGARILAENPDVGLSAAFLRATLVDALAIGRLDLGQVCRAAQVLIGADSHQGVQDDLSGLLCEALIWRMEELRPNVVCELFACLPLIAQAGEKGPFSKADVGSLYLEEGGRGVRNPLIP